MASAAVSAGDRVDTRFGPGSVLRTTTAGAMVMLDKLPGTPVEVLRADLSLIAAASGSPERAPEHVPRPARAIPQGAGAARRSIEALRFGVVPSESIPEITVGYDELKGWVEEQLPHVHEEGARVSEVCGSFGSGKSHTMAAIRETSVSLGYVTCHVEVNGVDVSLSDPEGVLRQLWPTARGTELESAIPLLDLNLQAIANGGDAMNTALADYPRVASNLKTIASLKRLNCLDDNAEDIEDFVTCGDAFTATDLQRQLYASITRRDGHWSTDHVAIKRLIGQPLNTRSRDFVDCLLGYALVARRAGFKGLVVTIDEFEVEYSLTQPKMERVEWLIDALVAGLGEAEVPLAVFIATVGQEGQSSDATVDALVSATGGSIYDLLQWTRESMKELARRIHALYCSAYGLSDAFDAQMSRQVERTLDGNEVEASGLVRAFIKRYVAMLDLHYSPAVA